MECEQFDLRSTSSQDILHELPYAIHAAIVQLHATRVNIEIAGGGRVRIISHAFNSIYVADMICCF